MNWVTTRLGDLGQVITGKTPSRSRSDYFGTAHPFVTPSDIGFMHYYCIESAEGISELGFEKYKNQVVPRSAAMCVCIGNTIGKCALAAESCLTNQQINSVIASGKNDPKFIYYLLCSLREQIRALGFGGGAAQPIINKSKFSAFQVLVPDPPVQKAIGECLSSYDDLIANNRRRIALLEEAARLLYRECFVFFRFPGHEHAKLVDGIPEGWEPRHLDDLVAVVKDQVKPTNFAADDIHIGLEHIPRRALTLSEWEPAEELESSKTRFLERDILFCKIRPYFHKVGFAIRSGLASSDAIVLRVRDKADWPLVLCTTSSDRFVAVASKTVREGSKMPRADWNVLKNYGIPKPPAHILQVFNDAVEPIAAQCKNLAFQNKALGSARDLLLQRLIRGEIAV